MNGGSNFIEQIRTAAPIVNALKKAGAISYLVGGSVRDVVMNISTKDSDIEVHRIQLEMLQKIVQQFGHTELIGKQFGVIKILGMNIDWSLPRTDSRGRKPHVSLDSCMTIEKACLRRDLTMNAMAINLNHLIALLPEIEKHCFRSAKKLSNFLLDHAAIIDPFGGLDDIATKTLRAVDAKLFIQDPLRFFRVMQFIDRFGMYPDKKLNLLCASMTLSDSITNKKIATERIYQEIRKLFLLSKRPSAGFRWLKQINRLADVFPELHALIGTLQRPDYHPEGDVFEHTMQALDAAAQLDNLIKKFYKKFMHEIASHSYVQEEKWLLMLASVCHDLGKPSVTVKKSDTQIHSWNHEKAGVPLAHYFLKRITKNTSLIKAIKKLVRYHMMPGLLLRQQSGLAEYRRLAHKLAPEVSMYQLGLIALCDLRARNSKSSNPLPMTNTGSVLNFTGALHKERNLFVQFIAKAEQAHILYKPELPILQGKDLLDVMQPGKKMGTVLKKAYFLQIDEDIKNKDVLKKLILDFYDIHV